MNNPRQLNRHHRRGGVYLLILGSTMLVTIIGITSMMAVQIQHRTAVNTEDQLKARLCAQAGIEMAAYWLENDSDWRTTRVNGYWVNGYDVGDGKFTLKITDPVDADLADSNSDSILVYSKGTRGDARHILEVTMDAHSSVVLPPIEALGFTLLTGADLSIQNGGTLTAYGAPVSTNAQFSNSGTLIGDVEAASNAGSGTVTGTTTIPAPAKTLPDTAIFDQYVAKATMLTYTTLMDNDVIAPGFNSYSAGLNSDGLYYINTGGSDLVIQDSRLHGTLLVDTGGGMVRVLDTTLLQNSVARYPVLMVKGHLRFEYESGEGGLDESSGTNVNYNPVGAPYLGITDSDLDDSYPSQIDGLVWCTGNMTVVSESSQVNGAIICNGSFVLSSSLTINHLPELMESPPEGFTQSPQDQITMQFVRGTWRQMVD
ncbi:MAG: hypothetical protein O7G85_05255 [Planctomycetota bacterium]|nr:hypothetical protein [Planctomycetota bacterium]